MEPNNFVHGGVRLNLAGREPQGCVQPNRRIDPLADCRRGKGGDVADERR